ncbi:MAG: glycosyltransferase [Dehalococcoidia bacterium]|nr:glycosyltransferase [Dehalococcoidia bacterium]
MSAKVQQSTVDVIIPALNEASTIGVVLDEIPYYELSENGFVVRALVVDNGSSDGTADVAKGRGASVVYEPQRGKGNAIRRAFRETSADYVVMLDGDATYPAGHITEMLMVLRDGHDVVIGSRLRGTRARGAISTVNVIGNHLLTWVACVLYWRKTSDLCTGYWAFRGSVLPSLRLTARGFNLEAELFSEVARNRLRMGEVPVHYRRRPTPTKLRALRDGMRIARMLLRKRMFRDG